MLNNTDNLNYSELLAVLGEARMKRVHWLDTVDSTNLYLRELARNGAEDGTVVIAGSQSKGRGRLGRSFSSPEGGIYMSWLLRPECPPAQAVNLTAWVSVAVADAIFDVYGVHPGIKWVNDLVMNTKKICGILTEMSAEEGHINYIIVGIGINVNAEKFPDELRNIASSLYMETGKQIKRAELIGAVIHRLDILRTKWPDEKYKAEYLASYRRDNITTGRHVTLVSGDSCREAFTESIDDDFALVVRLPDGSREHINSGEVSVKGIYGEK